jgi:hypothetical protein
VLKLADRLPLTYLLIVVAALGAHWLADRRQAVALSANPAR